jgi:hypothetical protein
MATCDACDREMAGDRPADTCATPPPITIGGKTLDPVPYGRERRWGGTPPPPRCHDCNVAVGGAHHPGCDGEECPACGGQLIGCGCAGEDDEG